jgi:hypothetical protein
MGTFLGEVVKQHHKMVLDASERLAKLRDRRLALTSELTQLGPLIAEAQRAVDGASELLRLSWDHYRADYTAVREADETSLEATGMTDGSVGVVAGSDSPAATHPALTGPGDVLDVRKPGEVTQPQQDHSQDE